MKNKEKIIKIFGIFSFIVLCIPISVFAWYTFTIQLQTWDLVDSGKHLDWSGSSAYISQFNTAVNTWNSYKSGVIRKDTLTTINDLTISDVSFISSGVVGQTSIGGTIKFATQYMNNYGSTEKTNVCIHELGHALRLDHRNESDSVMQPTVSSVTTLSVGDKRNYDEAYKVY